MTPPLMDPAPYQQTTMPRSRQVLAYVVALVGAPLVVALLGFWVFWIPVVALYLGGLPYLILAGPGFAIALRYVPPEPLLFGFVGLALNLLSPLVMWGVMWMTGNTMDWGLTRLLWMYGAVFAWLWGAIFALLYRVLLRRLPGPD